MDSSLPAFALIGLHLMPDEGDVRWAEWAEQGRARDRRVRDRCQRLVTLAVALALLVAAAFVGLR